jgi:hypothetical protein
MSCDKTGGMIALLIFVFTDLRKQTMPESERQYPISMNETRPDRARFIKSGLMFIKVTDTCL